MKVLLSSLSGAFNYARNLSVKQQLALFGVVTLLFTLGLSVTKLAQGLGKISDAHFTLLIIQAVVVDFGMLFFKAAIIFAGLNHLAKIKPWAYVGLVAFALMSAGFNCWSYCDGKSLYSFTWWMGIVLGCSVPFGAFLFAEVIAGVLNEREKANSDLPRLIECLRAYEMNGGDKYKTAETLGISDRHVNRQLKDARDRYGLEPLLN